MNFNRVFHYKPSILGGLPPLFLETTIFHWCCTLFVLAKVSREMRYPGSHFHNCNSKLFHSNIFVLADGALFLLLLQPFSRWWQLKYFSCSPRSLGKWSNLTNIFHMGWHHQLVFFLNELFTPPKFNSSPLKAMIVGIHDPASIFIKLPRSAARWVKSLHLIIGVIHNPSYPNYKAIYRVITLLITGSGPPCDLVWYLHENPFITSCHSEFLTIGITRGSHELHPLAPLRRSRWKLEGGLCPLVVWWTRFVSWHIWSVIALFPNSPFELIVGFDECSPLKV